MSALPAGHDMAPLSLAVPRPNPAFGSVAILFGSAEGQAELAVWDLAGRQVATLFHGTASGTRIARWDGRGDDGRLLSAGLYYLRLSDGRHAVARRLVLLR